MIELARAAAGVAGFLLPSDCLACRRRSVERLFEGGVCGTCWAALPGREDERCVRCDESLPGAPSPSLCGRCLLDPPPFETLRAAAPYQGSAREILLAFKFRGADYLAPRLARIMSASLLDPRASEIVCVPATPRSRRARGYHPAERLAASLSRLLAVPVSRGRLAKTRETEVQSRLPLSKRSANVRRAFRVSGRPPGDVLLVDDVATSAATARECAQRLAEAGARRVTVWCFARASRADLTPEPAWEPST